MTIMQQGWIHENILQNYNFLQHAMFCLMYSCIYKIQCNSIKLIVLHQVKHFTVYMLMWIQLTNLVNESIFFVQQFINTNRINLSSWWKRLSDIHPSCRECVKWPILHLIIIKYTLMSILWIQLIDNSPGYWFQGVDNSCRDVWCLTSL